MRLAKSPALQRVRTHLPSFVLCHPDSTFSTSSCMVLPLQFFGIVFAEDVHRSVLCLRDFFQCPTVVDITNAEPCWCCEGGARHTKQQPGLAVFTPEV